VMLKYALLAGLSFFSLQAMASCEDVKAQIDAKLQAKGVKSYSLEIVPADKNAAAAASGVAAPKAAGKVVGNCDNETKNIVYTRN
ncbi:MAG TPA: DUF1161 domain-containing protein, partial [Gallionellaceae bacterium]|nr:DUF1161 domain-containing protein [Gallionellaceae bacterium]